MLKAQSEVTAVPSSGMVTREAFDKQLDSAIQLSRQVRRVPGIRDFFRDLQVIRDSKPAESDQSENVTP